jgi:hypothetical protein
MPANKAGQLISFKTLGASANNSTVNTSLMPCHTAKLTAAAIAFDEAALEVKPRANSAAGITTAKAPYIKDIPINISRQNQELSIATTADNANCTPSTHHTDKDV